MSFLGGYLEGGLKDNEYEENTMEKEIRFAHLKYFFYHQRFSDFIRAANISLTSRGSVHMKPSFL